MERKGRLRRWRLAKRDRALPAAGSLVNACNEYGIYALPGDVLHRPAARSVSRGRVHEPDTIAFIRNRCGTGDVIHAGTFFGDFLPGIAAALAPGALLWAFEPNPSNFALAEKTLRLNRLDNVRLRNAALSDAEGRLTLVARDPAGGSLGGASHVVGDAGGLADRVVEVPALRVDDAVPADRPVSILQLDVEGHEKPALRGARALVERCRPILILERFDEADFLDRLFPALGYRPVGRLHGNVVYGAGL
jgi:FkbM family methyltransferase